MIMKDKAQSGYKPVQDDVLKTLGLAVIAGQSVEHLLSSCLTFPLHGEPLQTVEQLQILLERHSKATLGQLLKALRKRVDLHPTFDDKLDRFLQYRNVIAHRLHDVTRPRWRTAGDRTRAGTVGTDHRCGQQPREALRALPGAGAARHL